MNASLQGGCSLAGNAVSEKFSVFQVFFFLVHWSLFTSSPWVAIHTDYPWSAGHPRGTTPGDSSGDSPGELTVTLVYASIIVVPLRGEPREEGGPGFLRVCWGGSRLYELKWIKLVEIQEHKHIFIAWITSAYVARKILRPSLPHPLVRDICIGR